MKKLLISILLLWAGVINATTTFEPYVVRNGQRSAEETVRQLESSSHLWEFQKELQTNTPFHFGHLTKAVEDRELVTKTCGDCSLETAGIKGGKTVYHRHVRPEEMVAYLNGVPLFLPACGNPVRPLQKEEVAPTPPTPPVALPSPQPVVPPPQVRQEPPRRMEGCTPDQVSYTTEVYDLPATIIGQWGPLGHPWVYDAGAFSWTTSHHHWVCVENISETEE